VCAGANSFIALAFGSNQDSTRAKDRGRTDEEYNEDYRSKTDDLSPIRSINRPSNDKDITKGYRVPLNSDAGVSTSIKSY
jgi:hypothetical protein